MKNLKIMIRLAIASYLLLNLFFYLTTWMHLEFQLAFFTMRMSLPGLSFEQIGALSNSALALAALLNFTGLAISFWAMKQLWAMLSTLTPETSFSRDNIELWKRFSAGILAATAFSILELPLRGLLFSLFKFNAGIKIEVGVSTEQLMLLLFCLLSYLVAQLFQQAHRREQENKEFI